MRFYLLRGFSNEISGVRREVTAENLCDREGIHANVYSKWSKEFLKSGKQRLVGDIDCPLCAFYSQERYDEFLNHLTLQMSVSAELGDAHSTRHH